MPEAARHVTALESHPMESNAVLPEVPPIDRPSLVARCMGDAAFACMILGKFQARAPEMVAAIERALTAGDAAAAGRAAHGLKGAAANLSAEGVRVAAEAIESAGHDGDLTAAAGHVASLRAAMDRCLAYVPTLVAALQRGPAAAA
jgi:HPt (histidine-containing phosphotransfer) domain-containing protein